MSTLPLVVDLDGTLIHTDMLHESAFQGVGHNPLSLLKFPYWLSQGKTKLKMQLAHRSNINPELLPYNHTFLKWLIEQKEKGRQLILCTASHTSFANGVAEHLNIFSEVIASSPSNNLSGENKAHLLESRFGHAGFDYAGNAPCDIAVWKRARHAILVNTSSKTTKKAHNLGNVEISFPNIKPTLTVYNKALRTHQWVKNLLLFIPMIAAHQFTEPHIWMTLIFAFFAFSLCASSVYIMNDLLDLENDRQHPRKCKRPFAAGKIPVWVGVLLTPLLLATSFGAAYLIGPAFSAALLCYFLITCAYSWGLKRLVLVDCITLAMLYTMRIIAGAAASYHILTFWLLAFSVFLFLSLAFVKRYVELITQLQKINLK
ncbi:MAG: UbiA family prenyltransferase [Legionella sp.]|nr:UbiA family prenyltransferase [Legionella sp.]